MFIVDFSKSFFDFDRLSQFQYFIRYLFLMLISSFLITMDFRLLAEVNQNLTIVSPELVTEKGYFFIKLVQFLSFILFWLSNRRFKDIVNLESNTTLSFLLFFSIYVLTSYFEIHFIFVLLLLLIPAKQTK